MKACDVITLGILISIFVAVVVYLASGAGGRDGFTTGTIGPTIGMGSPITSDLPYHRANAYTRMRLHGGSGGSGVEPQTPKYQAQCPEYIPFSGYDPAVGWIAYGDPSAVDASLRSVYVGSESFAFPADASLADDAYLQCDQDCEYRFGRDTGEYVDCKQTCRGN